MLKESRIYKFLDNSNQMTIAFVEGQKLIQELALTHSLAPAGFQYFRDTVLSTVPMLSFLKPQEGLGLYIDNEDPYFRLKIEGHSSGSIRTLLLPADLKKLPESLSGIARFTKILPKNPYTSVIEINNKMFSEVINEILTVSYQMDAIIRVSEDSDQSILLAKLPDPNQNIVNDREKNRLSLKEYELKMKHHFNSIFARALNEQSQVQKAFEDLGLIYLGSNVTNFHCPCSKERMIANIITLGDSDLDAIFEKGPAEITCDYCKTEYSIERSELDVQKH